MEKALVNVKLMLDKATAKNLQTTVNITLLYIFIFPFLHSKQRDTRSHCKMVAGIQQI